MKSIENKLSKRDIGAIIVLVGVLLFSAGIVHEKLLDVFNIIPISTNAPSGVVQYVDYLFLATLIVGILYFVEKIDKWTITSVSMLLGMLLGAMIVFGHGPLLNQGYSNYDLDDNYGLSPYNLAILRGGNQDLEVGDIIAYKSRAYGVCVTHKIVAIEGDQITTQGMNQYTNPDPDPSCQREDVIGKVVTIGGYALFMDVWSILYTLGILLGIVLFLEWRRII